MSLKRILPDVLALRVVFQQIAILSFVLLIAGSAAADDSDVLAIHGDLSRTNLGTGTGVVLGFVDSGINSTHPALAGNDSLGNPRLVSQANLVTYENTTNDVTGHGTSVSSAAVSSDSFHTGLAPDARYISARVLDSNNAFQNGGTVMDGVGYAMDSGANILNLSLNYNGGNPDVGNDPLDLILDWAVEQGTHVTVAAGNIAAHRDGNGLVVLDESPPYPVTGPATFYNGLTVGRTGVPPGNPLGPVGSVVNYNQVFVSSRSGPVNGRCKPDVVAPGTAVTLANNNWQSGPLWTTGLNGTSISSPLVAGMIAQEISYGSQHGMNTNPLVIKATIMNSCLKVFDKDSSNWKPRAAIMTNGVLLVTSPLDTNSGAGEVDGLRLYQQYSAGQQPPGLVNTIGWDTHNIVGVATQVYTVSNSIAASSEMDATLVWFRHVSRTDDGDGIIDAEDSFAPEILNNLSLTVMINGSPVAESVSTIDNVQHLHLSGLNSGIVTIAVSQANVPGGRMNEQYGLAWNVSNPVSISGISFNGPDAAVQFNSKTSYLHDVQASDDLASGLWTNVATNILGSGGVLTVGDSGGAGKARRFYRIAVHL